MWWSRSQATMMRQTVALVLAWTLACAVGPRAVSAAGAVEQADTGAAGTWAVTSDPTDASVYIDGRFVGQTPLRAPTLSRGEHRVRLVKAGYLDHSRVVRVNGSQPTGLTVRLTPRTDQGTAAPAAALKIVVIEGEDAVNIIQQKTAVAPVVEVRDRNNQPVAGVLVKFAIRGGRATFSGARTLAVTTNAAGRAAVAGLTPTGSGAVQISATAAYQGQTAVAMITQTNVLSAAPAAGASGGAGTGAGGGAAAGAGSGAAVAGGAAASGGGLSVAAVAGIVGGAVAAAGTVVAMSSGGGDDTSDGGGTGATGSGTYSGTYSGQLVSVLGTCSITFALSGTVLVQLQVGAGGTVSGTAQVEKTSMQLVNTCARTLAPGVTYRSPGLPVTGSTGNLGFNNTVSSSTNPDGSPADGTYTESYTFAGTLSNSVITGGLTITYTNAPTSGPAFAGSGTTTFPMTLR